MKYCRKCGAEWSEFNLRKKKWVIPGDRYKTGEEHIVQLPTQAVKILKSLPNESKYLFTQPRADRPLTSDVIGKEINKHRKKGFKVHKDFSSHSLLHSGATWLAANECPYDVRERLLGHKIDKAQESYHTARNRLTEGRGNLVRRSMELRQLGVKAQKELPEGLVVQALEEDS